MNGILFVSNLYPPASLGGYEEACRAVRSELQSDGRKVEVLTSAFRRRECPDDGGVHRDLEVLTLRGWADASGEPPHALPAPLLNIKNGLQVQRRIRQGRFASVVIWNGGNLGRLTIAAAEGTAPTHYYLSDPWLAGVAGAEGRHLARASRTSFYRRAMGHVGFPEPAFCPEAMMFCSQYLRDAYARAGVDVEGSHIIPHGVAERLCSNETRRAAPTAGRIAHLYAGRLTPEKGVTTLLQGFARHLALQTNSEAHLTLMGHFQDDAYRVAITRMVSESPLKGRVTLSGARPHEDVLAALLSHDVFVFPSEWGEPFSIVLLEAMACGIPVVSTTSGGSAEIAVDGENCRTFAAGDPDDLCRQLRWVAENPQAAQGMARTARAQVARNFTLPRQAREIAARIDALDGTALRRPPTAL